MLIFTFGGIVVFKDWAFSEKTKVSLCHGVVLVSYNLCSYDKSLRYKHAPTHEKTSKQNNNKQTNKMAHAATRK